MDRTIGWSFLMSRSCFVPMNRARTLSSTWATSMDALPAPDAWQSYLVVPTRPIHLGPSKQLIVTGWMRHRQQTPQTRVIWTNFGATRVGPKWHFNIKPGRRVGLPGLESKASEKSGVGRSNQL